MPRAAVASSKANGTKREWCPGSLESPATLRRSGRTETLTGQASHTNSSAKGSSKEQKEKGRNIGAANGGKGLNLARTSCGEVRSLLAQTLRSGSWLSGIRISTAAFRQRIPKGDRLLCALGQSRKMKAELGGQPSKMKSCRSLSLQNNDDDPDDDGYNGIEYGNADQLYLASLNSQFGGDLRHQSFMSSRNSDPGSTLVTSN